MPLSPVDSEWRTDVDNSFSSLSLKLQNPNQNRVGQWLDARAKQGIAELSFQLAAELPLGTYTISVVNPKASSTFEVEKHGKMEYGEQRMGWNKWLVSVCIEIYTQMLSSKVYLLRARIKHKSIE